MSIVGGYEQFIELPLPAFFAIMNGLEEKARLEEKEYKKARKK